MGKYIDKDALVAEIERIRRIEVADNDVAYIGALEEIRCFLDTLEVKDVDLNLITGWFDHIAQIADDRKTANGYRMKDAHALDEIKCLAKNSSEFITMNYKPQKG